jgi:hypothetical protein
MAFTFDPTTDRGLVRLLIGDTDSDNEIYPDASVDAFLSFQGGNVKRAASIALNAMAANEAYIQKKVKVGDLTTDGPAVAEALRKLAQTLWDQGGIDEDGADFDIAEMTLNPWSYDEILTKAWLRNG